MRVFLRDFRAPEGHSERFDRQEQWSPVEFHGEKLSFPEAVHIAFTISSQGGVLHLSGRLQGELTLFCSRCTEAFRHAFDLSIKEDLSLLDGEESQDVWNYSFLDRENFELDLSEYCLLALLESLPLRPLCQADCLGLCQQCGQNLNQGACVCDQEVLDPRLAVLGQLLKKSGPGKGGVDDGITKKKDI